MSPSDSDYMLRAVALAREGLFTTMPNPRVGCVIVKNQQVVGEGYTSPAGGHHAEINALLQAQAQAQGATVYVTLEPCAHFGRTPPCVDALLAAGVARVIIGSIDPNPKVSGKSIRKLKAAGVAVVSGVEKALCDALNPGFFKRMQQGLPYVRLKLAMSLDAKIATASGESQWITGKAARHDVQQLRAQSCAILTSSKTVIADNPRLNVRLAQKIERHPIRVIIDTHLSVDPDSQLFTLPGETLVFHCCGDSKKQQRFTGVATLLASDIQSGHVNLLCVLQQLAQRQCNEILVEAGGELTGALLQAEHVDELIIYQAPKLLGEGARPAFVLPAVKSLAQAKTWQLISHTIIGEDSKTVLQRQLH